MSPTIAQFHDCRTCKISEHIICSSVSKHVETHGTLNDDQHGFRKNRSCMFQLILAIQDLAMRIDLVLVNTLTLSCMTLRRHLRRSLMRDYLQS